MLARDDGCAPRNRTVSCQKDADPNVVYWPSCTRLQQCGGCCGHDMLECAPTEEEAVALKVGHANQIGSDKSDHEQIPSS